MGVNPQGEEISSGQGHVGIHPARGSLARTCWLPAGCYAGVSPIQIYPSNRDMGKPSEDINAPNETNKARNEGRTYYVFSFLIR